jgi:hypothetical protein
MSPMDNFLQAVEKSLRGPAKLRPEVIEELRGHLTDRIEALGQQEYEPEEAEDQAIKEMQPAWLLAMRLSLANGWYLFPEILRELGALGFGVVVIGVAACNLDWIQRMVAPDGNSAFQNPNIPNLNNPWVITAIFAGYMISLTALTLFAFYMSRLCRSRIWAIFPVYFLFILIPSGRENHGFYYFAGAMFMLAAAWGAKKPSPRPVWPLLAAAGMVVLSGSGVDLAINVSVYHLPVSLKMATNYFYWSILYNYEVWAFVGASGFAWLGAWILERAHAPSITEASE